MLSIEQYLSEIVTLILYSKLGWILSFSFFVDQKNTLCHTKISMLLAVLINFLYLSDLISAILRPSINVDNLFCIIKIPTCIEGYRERPATLLSSQNKRQSGSELWRAHIYILRLTREVEYAFINWASLAFANMPSCFSRCTVIL